MKLIEVIAHPDLALLLLVLLDSMRFILNSGLKPLVIKVLIIQSQLGEQIVVDQLLWSRGHMKQVITIQPLEHS